MKHLQLIMVVNHSYVFKGKHPDNDRDFNLANSQIKATAFAVAFIIISGRQSTICHCRNGKISRQLTCQGNSARLLPDKNKFVLTKFAHFIDKTK